MACAVMGVSFQEWLPVRRRRVKFSQGDLAAALGVTRQTISNWERGGNPEGISLVVARKMAKSLGVSLSDVSDAIDGKGKL